MTRLGTVPAPAHGFARVGLLRDLDRPARVFAGLGPNWYASVMGTGVVGVAAATLPVRLPGLHALGTAAWLLASFLLVALGAAWTVHWTRHGATARGYARHPVLSQSWGAVAMGVLTVGTGTVHFGTPLLGAAGAVGAGWLLWGIGTALGLTTAVWIPYMMIVHQDVGRGPVSAGRLMPVVPPMVSAAGGALLVPHAAAGWQPTMVVACYAMFGISLFATLVILPQVWHGLVVHGPGPAASVPTMWIVLGPLGQSVTAANLLGERAVVLGEPYAIGARVFGVLYGVPAWGFAMLWTVLAAAVTIRTVRAGLPFGLTWWSFTFPVGTCVTGTSVLATRLGLPSLAATATALFVLLVAAWMVVSVRTVHGALVRGVLFLPASGTGCGIQRAEVQPGPLAHPAQRRAAGTRVAAADRLDHVAVVGVRPDEIAAVGDLGLQPVRHQPAHRAADGEHVPEQDAVVRGLGEHDVELAVGGEETWRVRPGLGHRVEQLVETGELGVGAPLRGQVDDRGLDRLPGLDQLDVLVDVGGAERPRDEPAVLLDLQHDGADALPRLHPAPGLQGADGLPDGERRGAGPGGELPQRGQHRAGGPHPGHDLPGHLLDELVDHADPADAGQSLVALGRSRAAGPACGGASGRRHGWNPRADATKITG